MQGVRQDRQLLLVGMDEEGGTLLPELHSRDVDPLFGSSVGKSAALIKRRSLVRSQPEQRTHKAGWHPVSVLRVRGTEVKAGSTPALLPSQREAVWDQPLSTSSGTLIRRPDGGDRPEHTSALRSPGPVAQRKSAAFTRQMSQVRLLLGLQARRAAATPGQGEGAAGTLRQRLIRSPARTRRVGRMARRRVLNPEIAGSIPARGTGTTHIVLR